MSCLSEISAQEIAVTVSRRGITQRFEFVNFKEHKFSFLNITALAKSVVKDSFSCAFTCLDNLACFSFNVAAFPDNARKLICEILSSDKYNNSENFLPSKTLHHSSIVVRNLRLLFSYYVIKILEGMTLKQHKSGCASSDKHLTAEVKCSTNLRCIFQFAFSKGRTNTK